MFRGSSSLCSPVTMLACHQRQILPRHKICRYWSDSKYAIPQFKLWKGSVSSPCWQTAIFSYQARKICGTSLRQFYAGIPRQLPKGKPKGTKLPFEVEANVPRDTLLYSYSNDQLFRMVTFFGIVQFFFWGNLAFFSYSGLNAVMTEESQARFETDTWWGKVLVMQAQYKYRMTIACMAVGYLIMVFTWLYPQRCISQLKLLRGGKSVRFQTYTHFGRKREFDVPLDHINCKQSRIANTPQISVKLKGSWFYYLLDNRSGHFHNTELFDYAVGLKRNF